MAHILFLNVSFGIFAFLPHGWVFMASIIALECLLGYKLLPKNDEGYQPVVKAVTLSNLASGALGIALSMWANGGWWLVVWMPWVGKGEVSFETPQQIAFFAAYYAVAFLVSVATEYLVNRLILKKYYFNKAIFKMTLWVNIASYVLGSIILYSVSFSNIRLL